MKDFYLRNADEAAKILGVSKPMVYLLSSQGRIRKVKIGGALRFRLEDLEDFINANTIEPRKPMKVKD